MSAQYDGGAIIVCVRNGQAMPACKVRTSPDRRRVEIVAYAAHGYVAAKTAAGRSRFSKAGGINFEALALNTACTSLGIKDAPESLTAMQAARIVARHFGHVVDGTHAEVEL